MSAYLTRTVADLSEADRLRLVEKLAAKGEYRIAMRVLWSVRKEQ